MLERLRGVAGVAQLVDAPRYPGSIVLADAGGTSLAGLAKPLAVDELIGLAVAAGPGGGGDAPPGRDAPGHQPGEHRDLPRRRPVPGRLRAGDVVRRDPSRVHAPHRDRGDAGVPGAGADRAYRPVGGSARRPVRAGRDAVRAGDGRAAVRLRRPVAAHPRSPGPGAGAAGRGEPGRAGAAVRDHHAPAGEGAGQPLPDGGRPASTTWSGCGTPTPAAAAPRRRARRSAAAAAAVAAGGARRGGGGAARRRSRSALAGRVSWGAGQRRAGGGQDGAGRRAAAGGDRAPTAGSWPASSTSTGGTWSSTRSIRRCARWAGCCWPSRRPSWPRCASGSCRRSAPTRGC